MFVFLGKSPGFFEPRATDGYPRSEPGKLVGNSIRVEIGADVGKRTGGEIELERVILRQGQGKRDPDTGIFLEVPATFTVGGAATAEKGRGVEGQP